MFENAENANSRLLMRVSREEIKNYKKSGKYMLFVIDRQNKKNPLKDYVWEEMFIAEKGKHTETYIELRKEQIEKNNAECRASDSTFEIYQFFDLGRFISFMNETVQKLNDGMNMTEEALESYFELVDIFTEDELKPKCNS